MKNIIILILALFVAGCATGVGVVKEARYINGVLKSGEVSAQLNSIDLSSYEEQVVTHALNKVANYRTKYGKYIADPSKLLTFEPGTLEDEYNELRKSFVAVEAIVIAHFGEYDEETQNAFIEYQKHAVALDRNIDDLLDSMKYRKAIKQALTAGMMGIQLIASLK